eukprot:11009741-Ditylum_brightwellii.AAC.1
MILGRDLLRELGIDLDFKENSIIWGDYHANMKPADITLTEHVANIEATKLAAADIAKMMGVKYRKVGLQADAVDLCKALNTEEKEKLFCVLQKHEELFDSTLGTWGKNGYDIKLQEGIEPYYSRPYTVPKAYRATICME